MELTSVGVRSFKKIASVDLVLGRTTILVGCNGSGKSSILQAIHLACCVTRQANGVERTRPNTVGILDLDYLPSNQYKTLGHGTEWGNRDGSACSEVDIEFKSDETFHLTTITLRSARNAGISISGVIPPLVQPLLRNRAAFFSAYVPGLSGIPNAEKRESKRVVLRASSFGDSNVYLRNILLLLREEKPEAIASIQTILSSIIDDCVIEVKHDNEQDLQIRCSFLKSGVRYPLELLGTGYLQVIQMLSYIYLFEPKILLIDEPDTHLHPSAQERLIPLLESAAAPFGTKIVLTTHSPFIVRGASSSTMVYWIDAGAVLAQDRELVEHALGWGAMGKKILLVSEDGNLDLLRRIIRQWPDIDRQVALLPGTGFRHLPNPDQALQLQESLKGSMKLFILRDRDALTDAECEDLSEDYSAVGVHLEFTKYSDIEDYFCNRKTLSRIAGISLEEVDNIISYVLLRNAIPMKEQYAKRRKAHNEEVYTAGGSPMTEELWNSAQGLSRKTAKGKFFLGQLLNHSRIRSAVNTREEYTERACNGQIAKSLKSTLEAKLQ